VRGVWGGGVMSLEGRCCGVWGKGGRRGFCV